MKNNATGEFELVVGNRQLLSAFFIVVLLFAVSFAMGYVVGQNTQRSVKVAEGAAASATPNALDRPQPLSPAPPPVVTPTASAPTGQATAPDSGPRPSTQPAQDAAAAAEAQPPAAAETAPAGGPDPVAGSYWQVMAVGQATAEAVKQTLSTKGFPVLLTLAPNNLTRVLVGPYPDTATLGRAKTDLENAGMHPVRYRP
jgi:cell division septation protein DedD